MTLTLHLLEQPEGGFIAKCHQFGGWRFESGLPVDHLGAAQKAEASLRVYAAEHVGIDRYLVWGAR